MVKNLCCLADSPIMGNLSTFCSYKKTLVASFIIIVTLLGSSLKFTRQTGIVPARRILPIIFTARDYQDQRDAMRPNQPVQQDEPGQQREQIQRNQSIRSQTDQRAEATPHHTLTLVQKSKNISNSIFLLKTHKTGGSVIQNILLRRVVYNNLTIALSNGGADWSRLCIFRPFDKNCVCNKDELPVDVIAHHMIFNKHMVQATLKKDAKFVSIIRDPVAIITSGYTYFGWNKRSGFETFERFVRKTERSSQIDRVAIPYRNLMMYIFGLKPADFDNEEKIKSKLTEIESTFDLIMINDKEHFHQSLILLKDLMNWSTEDIAVLAVNQQRESHKAPVVTEKLRELLIKANHADQLLYNIFLPIFSAKVETFGADRMKSEIEDLINKTAELKKLCISGTRPGRWNTLDYNLTPEGGKSQYCRLMASNELDLTAQLVRSYNKKAGRKACPVS